MSRLLIIALFFEIGVVLLVVPWSSYWQRNYFVEVLPFLEAIVTNHFVRGAVSGLGVVNLFAGVAEAVSLYMAERANAKPPVVTPPPATEERN